MIKSDKWIIRKSKNYGMIMPVTETQVSDGVISYGVSSYGYDIRLADEFKIFKKGDSPIIDPKNFDEDSFEDVKADSIIIPPNSFVLGKSVEYIAVPENTICLCVGKSTYARCGIIVNTTPLETMWQGIVTIEISNTTPLPAKVYANEGIAQILFFKSDERCETTYADRKGKYQAQTDITLPTVK